MHGLPTINKLNEIQRDNAEAQAILAKPQKEGPTQFDLDAAEAIRKQQEKNLARG